MLTIHESRQYYGSREEMEESALGKKFWEGHLGYVRFVPHLPQSFVDSAYLEDPHGEGLIIETCKLIYIAKFTSIAVSENSRLILNDQRRLIKAEEPTDKKRVLEVPITLNNVMTLLARRDPRIGGIHEESWEEIIALCGDIPVESHWSFLRVDPIDPSQGSEDFEVTPLIDRILLTAFLSMDSPNLVLDTKDLVLATITPPDSYPYRVLFRWEKSKFDPFHYYLRLYPYNGDYPVGVGLRDTKSR
jgi:hypothetical protein